MRPKPSRHAVTRVVRTVVVTSLTIPLVAGCGYDRIQRLDDQARAARSEMEVQLQRRAEVAPNLVETIRRYTSVDAVVAEKVADARERVLRAVRSGELTGMEEGYAELTRAIRALMSDVDRAPELRSDPGYLLVRSQLETTERSLERARRQYNQAVKDYNAYISRFPQLLTARVVRADRRPLFTPTVPDTVRRSAMTGE